MELELSGQFPNTHSNHIKANLVKMNAPLDLVQNMNGALTHEGRKQNSKHWNELVLKNIEYIKQTENKEVSIEKSKEILIDQMIEN